jgi:hypothetical protein
VSHCTRRIAGLAPAATVTACEQCSKRRVKVGGYAKIREAEHKDGARQENGNFVQ